jgi:hypothetical protein
MMKDTKDSFSQPAAEDIVLEGRCRLNSETGMHQVLFITEDKVLQTLLDSDLALIDDCQSESGLRSLNHSGYDPYARPNAVSKNPRDLTPRPRFGAAKA